MLAETAERLLVAHDFTVAHWSEWRRDYRLGDQAAVRFGICGWSRMVRRVLYSHSYGTKSLWVNTVHGSAFAPPPNGVRIRQFISKAKSSVFILESHRLEYGPDWRCKKLLPSVRVSGVPGGFVNIRDQTALSLGEAWQSGEGVGVLLDWCREEGHLPH